MCGDLIDMTISGRRSASSFEWVRPRDSSEPAHDTSTAPPLGGTTTDPLSGRVTVLCPSKGSQHAIAAGETPAAMRLCLRGPLGGLGPFEVETSGTSDGAADAAVGGQDTAGMFPDAISFEPA